MTGAEFKSIRQRLRLTQFQMAVKLGLTIATISRWEHGHCAITEPRAMWIRSKLDLTSTAPPL